MEFPKPHRFEIVLKDSFEIAENTRNFTFTVPEDFTFIPGQFLTLTVETDEGEKLNRSYSIASIPQKGEIQFCIKELNEGSGAVFDLNEGDKVQVIGPMGKFAVEESDSDKVFVTVGTGIAPFRSMIPALLAKDNETKIDLVAGFRYEKSALYHYEWESLAKDNKNFKYHEIISKPEKLETKMEGHVQDILEDLFEQDQKGMKQKEFYLCGMGEMVKSTRDFLKRNGVSEEQVHFERYS